MQELRSIKAAAPLGGANIATPAPEKKFDAFCCGVNKGDKTPSRWAPK
jgi:hypothetical protein